jgi:hypothetical protein
MLYNEDLRQLESKLRESAIEDDGEEMARFHECSTYSEVKVKFSPLQALDALRVVRGSGSHIF